MKHARAIFLVLPLFLTSCLSSTRFNALHDEVADLNAAVQADPGAAPVTKAKAARAAQDFDITAAGITAQKQAVATGDWMTLALTGAGAIGTIAAGMFAAKRSAVNEVMAKRDATSASRTVQDLRDIASVATFASNTVSALDNSTPKATNVVA